MQKKMNLHTNGYKRSYLHALDQIIFKDNN